MPLGGLVVGAVAPIVGGLVKGAAGVGKDTTATTDYQNTSQYNPTDHMYGGYAGGLQDNNANLNYREGLADTRTANTADFSSAQPDYQYAAGAASSAAADRTNASNVAGLMVQRATGRIPTVSEQQGAIDMRRAQQAQAAQAASARGASGVALAGQVAANNTANAQGTIAGQTQVNAAQERAGYTNAAEGAFQNIYGLDANARDAEIARQQYNANLATNQQQFNAQQQQANRDANDQRAMGYEQMQQHANDVQLQSNLQNQGQLAGSFNGQQGLHAKRGEENATYENANWDAIGKGMSPSGGGSPPVPGKAKGGPVAPGQPYIVGERGPELIVPQQPGYVIPHNQLPPALRRGGPAMSRNGLGGMGARDTASMLDDRAYQNFQPVASTAPLQDYLAEQNASDKASAQAAAAPGPRLTQAEWERRLVAGEPTARVRPQPDETAAEDARRGVAPGTTDFEKTEPKKTDGGAETALSLIRGAGAGFFGGHREEGGPVEPGKAYVAGEKGPEAVVPARQMKTFQRERPAELAAAREADQKGDAAGLKGVAQLFAPGMASAGLVNLARGGAENAKAIGGYLKAQEPVQTEPEYVQQPAVMRQEWRAAADAEIARRAAAGAPAEVPSHVEQPKTEQGKLSALYDWLFATSPQADASLARGGR